MNFQRPSNAVPPDFCEFQRPSNALPTPFQRVCSTAPLLREGRWNNL